MKEIIVAYDENTEASPVMGDWVGELVRCKDCEHRDKEIVPDGAWEGYVFCKKDCAGHKDDWFCADGKRRTDDA